MYPFWYEPYFTGTEWLIRRGFFIDVFQLTKDRRIELVSHHFQPLMDLDSGHQWLLTSWRGKTTNYVPSNRNRKHPPGSSHTNAHTHTHKHESKWTSRSNYWYIRNTVQRGTGINIIPAEGCSKQNPDWDTLQNHQLSFLNKYIVREEKERGGKSVGADQERGKRCMNQSQCMNHLWILILASCKEDNSEKAMASHSSTLAWKIPWMAEPGGLPSMGSHRVRHDWCDLAAAAAAKKIVNETTRKLWTVGIFWLLKHYC